MSESEPICPTCLLRPHAPGCPLAADLPAGAVAEWAADDPAPHLGSSPAWIWAPAEPTGQAPERAIGGKWLIFALGCEIEAVWGRVRLAVERGNLGGLAKVSTAAWPDPQGDLVICVYTRDAEDLADVRRVLRELRDAGIWEGRLVYKRAAETAALRYGSGTARWWAPAGGREPIPAGGAWREAELR